MISMHWLIHTMIIYTQSRPAVIVRARNVIDQRLVLYAINITDKSEQESKYKAKHSGLQ